MRLTSLRATRLLLRLLALIAVSSAGLLATTANWAGADTGVGVASADTRYVPGPDGTTIIVTSTGDDAVMLFCTDRACTDYERVRVPGAGFGPFGSTVLADSEGRVYVIEQDTAVRCDRPGCAGGTTTSLDLPPLRLLRITSDDRLAGVSALSLSLSAALFCDDPQCTGVTSHLMPQGASGATEMLDDEYVTYQVNRLDSTLTTYRCEDGCATSTTTTAVLDADIFADGETRVSLSAFVSRASSTPVLLLRVGPISHHLACESVDCSAPTVTRSAVPIATNLGTAVNDQGNFVYLQPGSAGFNGSVATCTDPSCATPLVSPEFNAIRRLSVDALGRPQVLSNRFLVSCDMRGCDLPTFDPNFRGVCRAGLNSSSLDMSVLGSRTGWSLRSGQAESTRFESVGADQVIRMDGRTSNGPVAAVGVLDGVEIGSGVTNFACDGPADHAASWSCMAEQGRIDVRVASAVVPATFDVRIGGLAPRTITIDADTPVDEIRRSFAIAYPEHGSVITTVTARPDGPVPVTITDQATGAIVFDQTFDIRCQFRAVAGPEATIVQSCMAGRGRIDTNIVNTSTQDKNYVIKLFTTGSRRPMFIRGRTVAPGDWWRSPLTGRPNGEYEIVVQTQRDGATPPVTFARRTVDINCERGTESIDEPEVQVVNACRDNRGYLMFIFTNNTAQPKPIVLSFAGVPNRSTTVPRFGQSVKFVTGRPNGTYGASVLGGPSLSVDVAC